MRRKMFRRKIVRYSLALLISVVCLFTLNTTPAFAFSVDDYFEYTYQIELSKTVIYGDEPFSVTVTGQATCKKDLPLDASEAYIVGRVIAQHQTTGNEIVLNPEYRLEIMPFPSEEGDTAEDTVVVSLSFPDGSQSGTYNIIGQLIEAKVKFGIWWNVTILFSIPETQAIGTVTYDEASSGSSGGGGGGGGAEEREPSGITKVASYVSPDGVFMEDVGAESGDGKVTLDIEEGTAGLTEEGEPLSEISITEMEDPPPPPEGANVIGLLYDLGPDGATFDPPITLTFTYDPDEIEEGVDEEDLVIATWDEELGEWVVLEGCTVDPVTHTITVPISHFTAFTVLALPRPVAFSTTDLGISPTQVNTGETVTITVLVTNTGDLAGNYEVILNIDGVATATEDVTLAGGDSYTVTFTTSRGVAGTCTVEVNGLSGTFTAKGPPAPPVPATATFTASDLSVTPSDVIPAEQVVISAMVTNTGGSEGSHTVILKINGVEEDRRDVILESGMSETVTFTIAKDAEGSYTVNIDGEIGRFNVIAPPPVVALPAEPAKPVNWGAIGGIIGGVLVVILVLWFAIFRRRFRRA